MESTPDQIVEFETALDAFLVSVREMAPASPQRPRATARRRSHSTRAGKEASNEVNLIHGSTQRS